MGPKAKKLNAVAVQIMEIGEQKLLTGYLKLIDLHPSQVVFFGQSNRGIFYYLPYRCIKDKFFPFMEPLELPRTKGSLPDLLCSNLKYFATQCSKMRQGPPGLFDKG